MGARDGGLFNAANLQQTAKYTFGKGFKVVNGRIELDLEPKSALFVNARDKVDFAFNAPFELQGNSPLALGIDLEAVTSQNAPGSTQIQQASQGQSSQQSSASAILRGLRMRQWAGI